MRPPNLPAAIAEYAHLLRARGVAEPAVAALEREFLVGMATLARFGYATPRELMTGDSGIELLHAVCAGLLAGEPIHEPGDLLRFVSRAAYRLLRRPRMLHVLDSDLLSTAPAHPVTAPESPGEAPDGAAELEANECRKANGGVHFSELAKQLGCSVRQVRERIEAVARDSGHDFTSTRFWLGRVGEALTWLVRAELEARVPDLLPTPFLRDRAIERLQHLLPHLRYRGSLLAPLQRQALRDVRVMVRNHSFPLDSLEAAAWTFSPDRFTLRLARVEWLRSQGELEAARRELERLASPRLSCRRRLLVDLAYARCHESAGDLVAAAERIEPWADLHRRDALLAFDRLVLAEATDNRTRAAAASATLRRLLDENVAMPAVLAVRVRERLRARGAG